MDWHRSRCRNHSFIRRKCEPGPRCSEHPAREVERNEVMITRNFSLGLMLATLCLSCPALAQQSKVIVIADSDCKLTANRDESSNSIFIHVNAQSILLEFGDKSLSYLFTDEGIIGIAHKERFYFVKSYEELQAENRRRADEADKYNERTGKWPGIGIREFRMTDETATISGLTAHKILQRIRGKIEVEIWASTELIPMRLREKIKFIYPEDHWKRVSLLPDLTDLVMLWGIPLKLVGKKRDGSAFICEHRVLEDSLTDKAFQVPPGYRREK